MEKPTDKVGQQTERPWWLTLLFGRDVWTVRDASGVLRPLHWVRRSELGTIEQERESSEWMWRRVVFQTQPSVSYLITASGFIGVVVLLFLPAGAMFIRGWGLVSGVALIFLMLVGQRAQFRRELRNVADGLANVLIDADRCPVCRTLMAAGGDVGEVRRCALCDCGWHSIGNQFAQRPKSWSVDHRGDPCLALRLQRIGPGNDLDESVWTPREYDEFMRAIKHRHFGPAIAPYAGWGMLVLASLFIVPMVIGGVQSGMTAIAGRTSLDSILGLVLIVVWIITGIRLTRSFGIDAETMRNEILARARCGSCGYPLSGIPREDDGCTACPECASAWRVPDLAPRGSDVSAELPVSVTDQ